MKKIAAILMLFLFCSAISADNLTEEQKLEKIKKELEENKQKLKKTKVEEQAVLGQLAVITKELNRTKSNLVVTAKKIKTNEQQIGVLSTELDQTVSDLVTKEKKLGARVKEVYKSGGLSYLDLVFNAASMSDFFNRSYFSGRILEYDSELVQGIRTDAQKVRQKKNMLEDRTQEIKSLVVVFAKKKQEIAEKAEEKNKLFEGLRQRRLEYEAQIAELEKSSHELELMILKKVAERKGGKILGSGVMARPLNGRITSRFGYRRSPFWGGRHMHTGLDIAAPHGTSIVAADTGEIIFSGWWAGYGKAIVIDHGKMTTTVYGHMSRIYKQVGDTVVKGQIIGLVGSTGYSTGPHLHFEVRKNGKPVNPEKFI